MEPDILVCGEEPLKLGSDDADDVAQHGDEDHEAVVGENETCAARRPYGPLERVETGETLVCGLGVPAVAEHEEVGAIPEDLGAGSAWGRMAEWNCACVEDEAPRGEELALEPGFAHD